MNTLEDTTLKNIITESLKTSLSYDEYREMVKSLVQENSTTGHQKTEDLVNYTMLNDRRMKRWDKTVKISEEIKTKFSNFYGNVTWLVITESWCGDAAHVIPVLHKLAELSEGINLRLVLRDANDELMDQFLTNGGRAIAKLIMIDSTTKEVLGTFGPRPSEATKLVENYKQKHGKITPEFKEDLQIWYNKDKGQNIIEDIIKLFKL
ncbi:thioredoxin family protein [Psychroserpens sp. Hel_I_66]|uniref:thioredoxin family protein n=1 Tax=Psychroserpens sp. Hel_I_66 TaxID=1250004 RepID=UPI00064683B3|nr:thioredoxin family protein [Psychroserpens sp. Hel_I_66]